MLDDLAKIRLLFNKAKDPLPVIYDRLGMMDRPYSVRMKDGLVLELRPKVGDRFAFYEILLRGDYTNGGQRISPGDTVIDVGANVGCFSVLASRMVGPTGRVIAIEPEEACFRQLRKNIELNGAANVIPLRTAIGAAEGTATLHITSTALFSSIYATTNIGSADDKLQEVPITTLDLLMQSHGVQHCHYLKLDCEGAEHDIVRTLTPEVAARIDQITMEVHRIPGQDAAQLHGRLANLGFKILNQTNVTFLHRTPSHECVS